MIESSDGIISVVELIDVVAFAVAKQDIYKVYKMGRTLIIFQLVIYTY